MPYLIRHRPALLWILPVLLSLLISTSGGAQLLNVPNLKFYLSSFQELLIAWNAGKLILDKESVAPEFRGNVQPEIQERAQVKPLGFETLAWFNSRYSEWNSLPNKIEPKLRLTKESSELLFLLYANNVREFAQVVPPDAEQVKQKLQLPLILTVGVAQLDSQRKGMKQIEVSSLITALQDWFTGYWPLCSRTARLVPMK